MVECTVKNCYNKKAIGDALFCDFDRASWRSYVEHLPLKTPNTLIQSALKKFQNGVA